MGYVLGGMGCKPCAVRSTAFPLTCAINPENEKGSCRSTYTEIEREGRRKDGKEVQHHRISLPFSLSSDSAPSLLVALLVYLTVPHGISRAPCAMYHFDVYHSCNRVLELANHITPPIFSGRGPSRNGQRVLN